MHLSTYAFVKTSLDDIQEFFYETHLKTAEINDFYKFRYCLKIIQVVGKRELANISYKIS